MISVVGRSFGPPWLILRPEQPPDIPQEKKLFSGKKKTCQLLVHDEKGGKATVQKEATGMFPLRFTLGVQCLRFDGQQNFI